MYRRRLRCKILQKKDQAVKEDQWGICRWMRKGPGCEGGSVGGLVDG